MNRELQRKIGRLFVTGFDGTATGEHARFLLEDIKAGNWIFFARNITGYGQLADLTGEIMAKTRENNGTTPFMTIDQEGGVVSRLHGDLNTYPGAMASAAAAGPEAVMRGAEITAGHLRSLGLNMNLAPVADINSNPANPIVGSRSYGDSAEAVTRYALAAAAGYRRGGVVPVFKHFPGHGDTELDSHKTLPSLTHPAAVLEKRELVPFYRGIKAGIPAVMVAHLLVPSLDDSGLPASLSPRMIEVLLRQEMGFQGLVLTDCLEMKGIRNHFTTEEAVVLAVKAGADLLFISHSAEEQEKGFKALYDEVSAGRISESRIDESLGRMKACRTDVLPGNDEAGPMVTGWTGKNPEPFLQDLSRRSITLLRDRGFLPPGGLPDSDETLILVFQRPEQFIGENTVSGGNPMNRLKKAFRSSAFRIIPADRVEEEFKKAPINLWKFSRILAVTADAGFYPAAVKALNGLIEQPVPVGIAVMRTPYEAALFPKADFLILGYENTVLGMDSLIAVLKGQAEAEGTCPVKIPGL